MKGEVKDPIRIVVLSLVTFGIYHLYWIYTTTKEIKAYLDEPTISPMREIVFIIITCGLYTIYWYYNYSGIIQKEGEKIGVEFEKDFSIANLLLTVVGWFTYWLVTYVAVYFFQSKLNEIWEKNSLIS